MGLTHKEIISNRKFKFYSVVYFYLINLPILFGVHWLDLYFLCYQMKGPKKLLENKKGPYHVSAFYSFQAGPDPGGHLVW